MPGVSNGTPAVTTMRSPAAASPRRSKLLACHGQRRVIVGEVGHQHRHHAPHQRELPEGLRLRGDGEDRHRGTIGRHRASGKAAGREADDDRRLEQVCRRAHRHGDRGLGARSALGQVAIREEPVRLVHLAPDREVESDAASSALSLEPRAMRTIASTDSRGYSPTAVSADSIRASVPSRIALATSEASARVGRGAWTIDSSIWVAVITGLPWRFASRIRRFWARGTSSNGNSTPRSPRATMMASAERRIPPMFRSAVSFSIFAMIRIDEGTIRRRASTSSPLDEGHGHVVGACLRRPLHLLGVPVADRRRADLDPGKVDPLVGLEQPP